MAQPFPIGDRCGFNLSAPEEVLLLEAFRLAEPGIDFSTGFMAKFRDRFLEGDGGVEERAIMVINDCLAVARIPAINRFYPVSSAPDEYMKTRGDAKLALRQAIKAKLADDAERPRVLMAARKQVRLLLPYHESGEARDAFEASLNRIHLGDAKTPAKLYAPPEVEPVVTFDGGTIAPTRPRGSAILQLERRVAPAVIPGALRVQNLAHDLALVRQEIRDHDDARSDAEAAFAAAQRRMAEVEERGASLREREAAAAEAVTKAIADL